MKTNPRTFAESFRKSIGFDRALFVAEMRMRDTAPSNWSLIPNSSVFNYSDKRKNKELDTKRLTSIHGFWTEVFHIIKKRNRVVK